MELRIVDIDLDIIRKKLLGIPAKLIKKENQINKIYDFSDKKLLKEKGYARIRIVEDLINEKSYSYMTTKKLLSQDKFKVMEENEVEIDDPKEGENIYLSLGLILYSSIKRYRESYKYKSTLIEIDINEKDFCPFPYIEIETDCEGELLEVLYLLGYSMEDTSSKTIFQLIEEYNLKESHK